MPGSIDPNSEVMQDQAIEYAALPAPGEQMAIAPFRLERYFAKYEFRTEYLLCASDCETVSVGDLLELEQGSAERLMSLGLGYTESKGGPALRREIAAGYRSVAPQEILVHSGAEEAIYVFMHALLSAGDHLVVHAPAYQSLHEVARSLGCEITHWWGKETEGWALDPDGLRRALRPNTRAIVLNLPHNPTGYLMDPDRFAEVNRIAVERGIVLFSDEVYRGLEYDFADRLPAACEVNETAVSLGVMSKSYGLPGLRIGWIATRNRALYEKMAAMKDYTTICSSAPSELLAEIALRHRKALTDRNINIIRSNLALLDPFFERHRDRLRWERPVAGAVAFPALLAGGVDELCHSLVTHAQVLLLPGSLYGDDDEHFRLGFGRTNMPEALARFDQFLSGLHGFNPR